MAYAEDAAELNLNTSDNDDRITASVIFTVADGKKNDRIIFQVGGGNSTNTAQEAFSSIDLLGLDTPVTTTTAPTRTTLMFWKL
jgi:hypothetical protein